MKKTMQLLFAMSIIIEGQNTFAGTNKAILPEAEKPLINTPAINPIKGQQYIAIMVFDGYENPIAGATVNAPCTGMKPVITGANGVATFILPGACNCNGAPAYVTTSTCSTTVPLQCNNVVDAFCK